MNDVGMSEIATLSNEGMFTIFEYNGITVRFRTSSQLEGYTEIKKWDNGYIEVIAKYRNLGEVEEYIDLKPILENLYIESEEFLAPIRQVRIS